MNNTDTPVTDVKPQEMPPVVNPKQYLLMVNEISMLMLSKMFNGIEFLEVEGMHIKENERVMVMVTPIKDVTKTELEAPQES